MNTLFRRVAAEKKLLIYLLVTLTVIIPVLALLIMGFIFLWMVDGFLWFGLGVLGLSMVTWVMKYVMTLDQPERDVVSLDTEELAHLPAIPEWSAYDNQTWERSLQNISSLQLTDLEWPDIPRALHNQLNFVARTYHNSADDAEYAFTVPELLLMMEDFSRRYRSLVLENIPFSQNLKVSTAMKISQKTTTSYRAYKKVAPVIDVVRAVMSGGSSLSGRVASELMSELGSHLSTHMQKNMKQLLFEQVSQVAIDLYSGRLKLSEQEMVLYRQSIPAPGQAEIRPLHIMMMGQVNAGKSSLINALLEKSVAEVDLIAATQGFHNYQLTLADDIACIITDAPGLDGNESNSAALLDEATKADLLLWLCQGNQPAKALDKQLMDEWDRYFSVNLGRKKPPVLLIITHIDMLKPQYSWQPPYDLDDITNQKAQSIVAASRYTRDTLGIPDDNLVVPIALRPGEEPYNIEVLRDIIVAVSSEARSVQLNRERLDAARSRAIVSKTLSQTKELLGKSVQLIFR